MFRKSAISYGYGHFLVKFTVQISLTNFFF